MARILVIDENDAIRRMLGEALGLHGYEVLLARDGVDGLRIDRAQPSDLVITDILMPEREGLECIVELRRTRPDVPVIAMSGGSFNLNVGLAERLGAHRTFRKPFDLAKMLGAVRDLLDSRTARSEGDRAAS